MHLLYIKVDYSGRPLVAFLHFVLALAKQVLGQAKGYGYACEAREWRQSRARAGAHALRGGSAKNSLLCLRKLSKFTSANCLILGVILMFKGL